MALDCRKRISRALKLNMSGVRSRTFRELICRLNKRFILLLPLLLVGSIFVGSTVIPRAHALTGTVCITASATATSWPAGAPSLCPITPGQNFTVGVFIQGSDAMGGFDIMVQANSAFLNPRTAALGPVMASPSLTSICVNGSSQGAAATSLVWVVFGIDGNLYYSPYNGAWGPWSPLAGQTPSSPALCASGSTTSELLVRGTDNSIYDKTFTSGTPGSFAAAWDKNPTGVTIDSPVCAVIGTTLHVVVRGATSELFYTTFDLTAHTWAASWTDLLGSSPSTPALAATPSLTRLDLVVRGGNNQIYHKAFTAGAWAAAWDSSNRLPVPDKTIASPVIASDGSILHVIVIGTESNLWYATLTFAGAWSTYTSLAGAASVPPALAVDASNNLHLVVRGFDAQLYSKSKPSGGAWDAAWVNAGGVLANSSPAAVTFGTSTAVIVQGVDNGIWYNTLTGSTWSGYSFMNGQASRSAGLSTP